MFFDNPTPSPFPTRLHLGLLAFPFSPEEQGSLDLVECLTGTTHLLIGSRTLVMTGNLLHCSKQRENLCRAFVACATDGTPVTTTSRQFPAYQGAKRRLGLVQLLACQPWHKEDCRSGMS